LTYAFKANWPDNEHRFEARQICDELTGRALACVKDKSWGIGHYRAMPRYTFIVEGDAHSTTVDFHDDNDAWTEAIYLAGEILRDIKGTPSSDTQWRIDVTNESDQPVATVQVQAQRHQPGG
jgi:hypothetical protein